MVRIFLSYAREDRKKVGELYQRLAEAGYTPWMDTEDLYGGERWEPRIKAAIRRADFFLACLSTKSSNKRGFLQKEIRDALEIWQEQLEDDIYLIPARLEDCESPELLQSLQWVNLFEDDGWTRLVKALQEGMKRRTKSVELPVRTSTPFESPSAQGRRLPETDVTATDKSIPPADKTYASIDHALFRLGARPYAFRREPLTSEVLRRIRQGPLPIVVLQGLAGVGKTTLLCTVARELRAEFPHALAVKFVGPSSLEPAYVLEEINAFLTSIGRGIEPERLREQNPKRTFAALVSRLADLRLLMLLDAVDATPPTWLDLLLQGFAAAPQARILVTARHRPASSMGSHVYVLPLSDAEAVAFAAEHARVFDLDVDPEELIKRLPLTLRSHPQALTTLLAHLSDFPLDLLLVKGMPEDACAPVRLIEQTITALDAPARTALAFVDMLADIDLTQALQSLQMLPPEFLHSLQVLLSRSLVHRIGTAYAVPAIVREALAVAEPAIRNSAALQVAAALQRAITELEKSHENPYALATISTHVVIQLRERGQWEWVHTLTQEAFLELLNTRGYWKEYSLLLQLGIEAAIQTNDRPKRIRLGFRLMRKLLQTGEPAGARAALAEVETLIGMDGDTLDHAELHSHRALLYDWDRDLTAALHELQTSRRIHTVLGNHSGLAVVEKLIGNVHLKRQEYDQARQAYEAALQHLADDQAVKDGIEVETSLALCDLAEGSLTTAASRLQAVIDRCHRFGYDAGLPRAQLNLALVIERQERLGEALALAQAAAVGAETTDRAVALAATMLASRLESMMAALSQENSNG